jgi:hypothetical protein
MLFMEITAVYCENRTEPVNTLFGEIECFVTLQHVVNIYST